MARVADGEELLGGQVLQHRAQLVGCEHGEGHDRTLEAPHLQDARACFAFEMGAAASWRTGDGISGQLVH